MADLLQIKGIVNYFYLVCCMLRAYMVTIRRAEVDLYGENEAESISDSCGCLAAVVVVLRCQRSSVNHRIRTTPSSHMGH